MFGLYKIAASKFQEMKQNRTSKHEQMNQSRVSKAEKMKENRLNKTEKMNQNRVSKVEEINETRVSPFSEMKEERETVKLPEPSLKDKLLKIKDEALNFARKYPGRVALGAGGLAAAGGLGAYLYNKNQNKK